MLQRGGGRCRSWKLVLLFCLFKGRGDLNLFKCHWEGSQLRERNLDQVGCGQGCRSAIREVAGKRKNGLFIQQILSACPVPRNSWVLGIQHRTDKSLCCHGVYVFWGRQIINELIQSMSRVVTYCEERLAK